MSSLSHYHITISLLSTFGTLSIEPLNNQETPVFLEPSLSHPLNSQST